MAIKAFSGGISQQPLPDFNLTDIRDGDMLQFKASEKAFVNIRALAIPTSISDLTNDLDFVTNQQLQQALAGLGQGGSGSVDLTNYYTKPQVDALIPTVPTNVSAFTNDADYLTSADLPDTTSFVTSQQLNSQLAPYATQEWVLEQIAEIQTGGDLDFSTFVTEAELNTAIANATVQGLTSDTSTNTLTLDSGWDLIPATDGQQSLGSPTKRFTEIYIDNSTINIGDNALEADANDNLLWNNQIIATQSYIQSVLPTPFSGDYNDLTNKPTLFSGSYTDLTNTPDLAVYATNSYVDAQIAAVQSGGQIDLSGYITQTELNTTLANYQPTVDLSSYATEAELNTAIAGINNTIAGINTFSGDYNDLTNAPTIPGPVDLSGYALRTEIPSITGLATTAYVDSRIPDPSQYVTNVDLTNALANYQPTVDLSAYATEAELNTAIANITIPTNVSELTNDAGYITNTAIADFITEEAIDSKIASAVSGGTVDLSNFVTESELNTAITALNNFSGDYNDLTNAPTIPVVPTNVAAFINDAGYQTAQDVQNALPDLSPYALIANLPTAPDLSNYALRSELPSLVGYATVGYVDSRIDATHQDLVLNGTLLSITNGNTVDLAGLGGGSGGTVDLTGYATETYVQQQVAAASLDSIANLDDLSDVAVGSLPQQANANEHYLLEYNPVNQLWESRDFGSIFATQQYVTETVATIITDGDINLDGYATEQFVEQKLVERGDHFSGDYYDLANTPILFSGDYRDLTNKPADNSDLRMQLVGNELQLLNIDPEPDTIISTVDLSDLGAAIANDIDFNNLSNLPDFFSGDYNDLVNRPNLFSGNYNDLRNKPYIPSIAGLATEEYVDNRWAEPEITGDRFFTHDVEVQGKSSVVAKTSTDACARHDNYVMCVETDNSVTTEALLVDGSRIVIDNNSTVMYEAHIIGSTGTHKYGIRLKGIADHTNGTLSLIGSPSRETLTENEYAWTADVTVDSVNNSLKLTVVGSENIDVHWTIFVECNVVKR